MLQELPSFKLPLRHFTFSSARSSNLVWDRGFLMFWNSEVKILDEPWHLRRGESKQRGFYGSSLRVESF